MARVEIAPKNEALSAWIVGKMHSAEISAFVWLIEELCVGDRELQLTKPLDSGMTL